MGKTPPKEKEAEESPWKMVEVQVRRRRASDEKLCKCDHVITESAIEELTAIEEFSPSLNSSEALICYGCTEEQNGIVRVSPEKSDILMCMTCYENFCCGSGSIAYPFGHSRAHALKEKHWFAVLCCDPERGYCFKCNAEVKTAVKFGGGQTGVEVNPKKVEMTGKVQAEIHPSGVGLDLGDKWNSYESRSSDAQGYAIRGIPNLGNTCYMSAVLQCLSVLGKLRERMLAPDPPKGILPELLKELFVEASAAGDELDTRNVLKWVGVGKQPFFRVGAMEDSHAFLRALLDVWKEDENICHSQSDAPTVIDSIFGFVMLQTLSCKKCGPSVTSHSFLDLKLDFPPKSMWHPFHPIKSAASPQTSEGPRSRKREIAVQLFPADVQRNLEKMETVSDSGYSRAIGSEVIVEKTHKPLEVDSTQVQRISQTKDVVQSPLQIQEGKSVDSLIEEWCCPNCAKDHEEPSASQSKNSEQIVGSSKTLRFITLPPVLTLPLNRTSMVDNTVGIKITCHVRFREYLDVERYMDLSSVDKGSTLYRLAGVVEHIGEGSLKSGHDIAYVKARRLGNQQEGSSCSSSWFRADDSQIRQVTLEQVLNSEAYILFYERMENQDISGTRRQN